MGQYKVLQDIEAEDKLLGPLSLRQFIYAIMTIVLGFISFKLFTVGAWFIAIPFIPPTIFFAMLAAPLGGDQSSEVWLLAKIRFFVKPKRRIWDQDGIEQLVTITVPKVVNTHTSKGFSDEEAKSRLKALAVTLDTRGWAVKNMTSSVYGQGSSDRLLDIGAPMQVVDTQKDILDPNENPEAKRMEQMIDASAQVHRQELMDRMNASRMQVANLPTINPTPRQSTPAAKTQQQALPQTTPVAQQPALPQYNPAPASPYAQPQTYTAPVPQPNLAPPAAQVPSAAYSPPAALPSYTPPAPVEQPLPPTTATPAPAQKPEFTEAQAVTTPTNPDILKLVHNDDQSVDSTADQGVTTKEEPPEENEVVISLH